MRLEEAFRKLTRPDSPSLVANNHVVHKYLVEGVPVEYQRPDGSIGGDLVRVLDYDNPENNEFLAVNQFTVVEDQHERRPDIVLFVNGLPLAVIELKNAADESATIWSAFNQLADLQAADPVAVRLQRGAGDLRRRAGPDRHADGQPRVVHAVADHRGRRTGRRTAAAAAGRAGGRVREAAVPGPDPALHRVRGCGGGVLVKKMAGYHQFHAVNLRPLRDRPVRRPCRRRAGRPARRAWSGTPRARARA